jgi:hypothetical protein
MTDPRRTDEEVTSYVRSRTTDALPDDFVEAVMRDVERTPQGGASWARWTWPAGLAAAAAVAVLVLVGLPLLVKAPVGVQPSRSPTPGAETARATDAATEASSPTPDASPTPTGEPTRATGAYGPIWSQQPQAAFSAPDSCENPGAISTVGEQTTVSYRIWMPDEWYYNEAFDGFAACSLFGPTAFEATTDRSVQEGVAITDNMPPGGDFGPGGTVVAEDRFTVAGLPAIRYEIEPAEGGFTPYRAVVWIIGIEGNLPAEVNPSRYLAIGTDEGAAEDAAEFENNIDVLDRMVATFELLDDGR